jgi:hypothetical protein
LGFDPGTATRSNYSTVVHAVPPLPGGNVLLGGEFTMANGAARANLVRLLPNGAVDTNLLAFSAPVHGGQEQAGHCRQQQVVMKPQPRPAFIVVQPQVALVSLEILLHRETPPAPPPTAVGVGGCLNGRGDRRLRNPTPTGRAANQVRAIRPSLSYRVLL